MKHSLPLLPPKKELETKRVLKQLVRTNKVLAELKGYARTIPNQDILINALTISEAKDSSAIENIVTTYDELYRALTSSKVIDNSAKEVIDYRSAMWLGYNLIKEKGYINTNIIVEIQKEIEHNNAGIRTQSGTVLKNEKTGEIIYTPPGVDEVLQYMKNLEDYINEYDSIDPLIKLAIIHYQFESIHPFYDGNRKNWKNNKYIVSNIK